MCDTGFTGPRVEEIKTTMSIQKSEAACRKVNLAELLRGFAEDEGKGSDLAADNFSGASSPTVGAAVAIRCM